ncbi:Signal transducer regulating beta-lactamase production, contains metallopeptidase domain [Singulisphaera sp. GP187]|uniref:M56 family metallopeptidase n=1 Tax=Singulisphaera sp. GP187 TaxID=1882752 RepID=UPI000925A315|nr:M56 family metallopeptidase [Singulisphaera sp. GP187]SIO61105.1 Signal transducer regulating beta-lactamase production, contains metallopeptidase domain [Singulisphaera sp. GP187]
MSHDLATLTTLLMGLALTWLAQSTLLLGIGLLAGRLVRKSGPAVQSAVYRTTLAGVLVCPIASALLTWAGVDGFKLRLPPPRTEVSTGMKLGAELRQQPIDEARPAQRFEPGLESISSIAGMSPNPEPPVQPIPMVEPKILETQQPAPSHLLSLMPMAGIAFAVWLIGSVVLMVRLLIGQRRMARLRSAAVPVEADAEALCREIADRLRLTAPSVLRSPFLFSPCLDGLWRPAILLPDDVVDNLRETFVHELAHLARRDGLWNLLRRLASANLWIQPLLWILSRRLEVTAEEVCDDYVVQHGADRARYAGHLVELAGRALPPTALSGVGISSLRSLLGQRVVRILDSSRSLSTRAGRRTVAAALIAGIAGTLLAGLLGVSGARKEVKAAAPQVEAPKPDAAEKADDNRTVHGQVIDPDGKPVPGATVYLTPAYGYLSKPNTLVVSTTAGADGRFIIEVPETREFEHSRIVSAGAPGFGVGWVKTSPGDRLDNLGLQLEVDDAPIDGQIVDLEGNPIVGASLRVIQINASPLNDLGPWLAAVERKEGDPWELEHRYLSRYTLEPSSTALTDAEGRFRITGIGRNRVAWLQLESPKVVSQQLRVLTRPGKAVEVPHGGGDHETGEPLVATTYFGASFRHAAAPTRPIVGVVRDADTKKPLAGVPIRSRTLATRPNYLDDIAQTVTDAEGHFRLTGMPKGKGNTIVAVPKADQPYAPCVKEVPDGPGLAPVSLEIELRRGVWIEGKITDKATGKPVTGFVEYFAHSKNPSLAEYPEFDGSVFSHHHPVQEDGSYRIAGLPGPGLVAVLRRADYLSAPERDDEFGTQQRELSTAPYHLGFTSNYSALAEVDPPRGSNSLHRDITLDPGSTFPGIVLGPDGKPMTGARSWAVDSLEPMKTAEFTVSGMAPKEPPRDLVFLHPERGLVGIVRPPQEKGTLVTVRMRTGAMATGRLVDSQGKPRPGMPMRLAYRTPDQEKWWGYPNGLVETDTQGRFTIKALVPEYTFQLREGTIDDGPTFGGTLRAGELIDLGDIRIEAPKVKRADATATALKPSDKPKPNPEPKPADMPITGRIVDLEGRPIPGVTVQVDSISKAKGGDLTPWLEAVRRGEPPWAAYRHLEEDKEKPSDNAETDPQGRFRIEGLNAEKVVTLSIAGPTVAYTTLDLVTRRIEPFPTRGFHNDFGPGNQTVYGADLTFTAAPGRVVEGVVRDEKTKKVMKDVEVRSLSFAGSNVGVIKNLNKTRTNGEGRFRLAGFPKGRGNKLLIVPNDDQPFFMQGVAIPDTPGLGAISVEIALHRGIWIEGKLTDKETGAPVAGAWLHYLPFVENHFVQATPEFRGGVYRAGAGYQDRYQSKADGTYRLVGLPGRAIVGAVVFTGKPYRRGAGAESIQGMNEHGHFATVHNPITASRYFPDSMKEIEPAEDTEVVDLDLTLDPGAKIHLRVVDPQGKPVTGVKTGGCRDRGGYEIEPEAQAEIDVVTLGPEEDRMVWLVHEGRKLGRLIHVKEGDDKEGPVVVKLEPSATITGRIVDPDGNPVSGAIIRPGLKPGGDFSLRLPQIACGNDGRFTVPNVPTGCDYSLVAESWAKITQERRFAFKDAAVRPGETTDLGDIPLKD